MNTKSENGNLHVTGSANRLEFKRTSAQVRNIVFDRVASYLVSSSVACIVAPRMIGAQNREAHTLGPALIVSIWDTRIEIAIVN